MSEYTPKTENVASYYVEGRLSMHDGFQPAEEEDFYRWLAEHDAEVAKSTEERIIKRLEEEREKHIPWCGEVQPCPKCYQTIGLETAIALTERENA